MRGEGLAYKIAPEQEPDSKPEEEFLTEEIRNKMRDYRKRQIGGPKLSESERKEFMRWQDLETEAKTGFKPLSKEEREIYSKLSVKDDRTEEETNLFLEYQRRADEEVRKAK